MFLSTKLFSRCASSTEACFILRKNYARVAASDRQVLFHRRHGLQPVDGSNLSVKVSSAEVTIPVPLQKVRKKQGTGISLRSKAPGGTNKYPFKQKEPSDIFNWNGYT